MATKRRVGRPAGSKNKPKTTKRVNWEDVQIKQDKAYIEKIKALSERQDQAIAQATDEINELRMNVEFYRKQVNHLIALLNILTKGA